MKRFTLTAALVAVAIFGFSADGYTQTFSENGYIDGKTAGTQEGKNLDGSVNFLESTIVHPTHTDGFVDANDPIVVNATAGGGLVGVAINSAAAATDYIPCALGGKWNLAIVGSNDAGNSAVASGDYVYINTSTGVLSKIRNANTQRPFGFALGTVASGATTVAAVLVYNNLSESAPVVVGTSAARFTTSVADTKFIEYRFENSATSGDNRAIYNRLYLTGAGSGGESLRSFTTVEDVAAGTAHGAHISLNFGDTGSVTGLGAAVRSTLHVPNAALTGGTYAAGMSEVYHDGASSDVSGATKYAIHNFANSGNATGQATMEDVLSFTGLSSTQFTTGTNAVIDHVLQVDVNGTTYWIGLYDAKS